MTAASIADNAGTVAAESTSTTSAGRIIGIQHRRKKKGNNEPSPTMVVVLGPTGEVTNTYEIESDDFELDFVRGRFPTGWRKATDTDDLTKIPPHHIKRKKIKDEEVSEHPANLIQIEGKQRFLITEIPSSYDGLKEGDRVAMVLGGSGDRLAYATANRGEQIRATTFRLAPFVLKEKRTQIVGDNADKTGDAHLLATLLRDSAGLFYQVRPRDRELISLIQYFRDRIDMMKVRIAASQRAQQRQIGRVFLSPDGQYPEGLIEDTFAALKGGDEVLRWALTEEKAAEADLKKACANSEVYQKLFDPIEGMGPLISTRIIAAIGDIRRFSSRARLKAFMGVHVLEDGTFVRRRVGRFANWHPDARQALYLFVADQCNRRPDSDWGIKLRWYKARLRKAHPEAIVNPETGKKRYTDGHIHKMAIWKTASKFAEWLFVQWWNLENGKPISLTPPYPPEDATPQTDALAA